MKSAILITYIRHDALNEAISLCNAAGYRIVHIVKKKFLKKPKYGISAVVLEKLKETTKDLNPDVIIFDELLKPRQNYNLASELRKPILDRESLILEIFESRSSSKESQLQIKLAKLKYEMIRAKEKVRLTRIAEQPGFMGIGKFEVDVYYDDIKNKMQTIKPKLEKVRKQRELHRQGREKFGFKTISLAGYTSSGKTTLFNKMTGEVHEQSKQLFTTLSTTTRRITINGEPFLLSDTVGFISKLPAYMITAFKSTLEELLYTNIIIVVVDISDSSFELQKKFKSCMRTLNELGVKTDQIFFALNKSDLLTNDQIDEQLKTLNFQNNNITMVISAKTGKNIEELQKLIFTKIHD